MFDSSHTILRKSAAEILGISLRTLDRYVRKNHITAMRRGRELYFEGKEIMKLKADLKTKEEFLKNTFSRGSGDPPLDDSGRTLRSALREAQGGSQRVAKSSRKPVFQKFPDFIQVEKAQKKEASQAIPTEPLDEMDIGFAKIRDELLRRSPEEGIFKALFEKNDQELKEARKKLDMATFRLGSLEAQIKSMVPLIEYRKKKEEILALAERATSQQKDLKMLQEKLKAEMIMRRIYVGFLFFIMGLVPLLLILRLFS